MATVLGGLQKCFISAPFGYSTSRLEAAFASQGVAATRFDELEPGSDVLEVLERQLQQSDFVCGVLPLNQKHDNVLFEIGFARGLGRRIVLLVDPELELSTELSAMRSISARVADGKELGLLVPAMLADISTPVPPVDRPMKKLRPVDVTGVEQAAIHLADSYSGPPAPGMRLAAIRELEISLATAFRNAGAAVVTSQEDDAHGADLALWVDELQTTLGNPILVEIKAGELDTSQLAQAEHSLRKWLLEARSFFGLLLYWDAKGGGYHKTTGVLPLVHVMSVAQLLTHLRRGTLAKELVSIRNRAVHGG